MYAQIVMTALLAGAGGDVGPATAERPTAVRRGAEDARPARDRASRLAGGRAGAMQLLDLIQTTVAPSSWQPYGPGSISVFGGGGGAAGGGRSGARRLVDVIQENVRPQTWDVNGGYGTIHVWPPK